MNIRRDEVTINALRSLARVRRRCSNRVELIRSLILEAEYDKAAKCLLDAKDRVFRD